MTSQPDLFAALAAPFDPNEVKVRSQNSRLLHYITARTVMNRLDSVLGPENWWDDYVPGEKSVLCRLTIRLPDGSTLTKADAGGYAGMSDSGDDDKSGYSDAFKRAAVKFGVSRYLYRDGVPRFVQERVTATAEDLEPRAEPAEARGPQAPAARPPQKQAGQWGNGNGQAAAAAPQGNRENGQRSGPPRSGKALFAWCREMEEKHQVGLIKYLNGWSKLQELPARMVDFDAEQVALAYAEAVRKIQSIPPDQQQYEEALSN